METLEGLRRKIRAAEDLQSVVKTMKSLAAVNIRQYDQAVRSLAQYSRTIELGFTECEVSNVVETNEQMLRSLEHIPAERYKTYRVFRKQI